MHAAEELKGVSLEVISVRAIPRLRCVWIWVREHCKQLTGQCWAADSLPWERWMSEELQVLRHTIEGTVKEWRVVTDKGQERSECILRIRRKCQKGRHTQRNNERQE